MKFNKMTENKTSRMPGSEIANSIKGLIILFFLAQTFLLLGGCRSSEKSGLTPYDLLYITRRPPLDKAFVLDLNGESYGRKLLAVSLQGVVNRKKARLFILGDSINADLESNRPWECAEERNAAQFWLSVYQTRYGLELAGSGKLEGALDRFPNEARGYVLFDETEPWTINAATTIAAVEQALIVAPDDMPVLESRGYRLIDDLRGRWPDARTAYQEVFTEYYPRLTGKGIALISPGDYRLRDFLIEQEIMAVYSRPSLDDWDFMVKFLAGLPDNLPVFGYVALTADEEVIAVYKLSELGKYLIPSDTTPNLSFHVSVTPSNPAPWKDYAQDTSPCVEGKVNVAIALSDGDNLVMPLNRYIWPAAWPGSRDGRIPLGWSFSQGLSALAPAVSDYYRATATNADERITMFGIGYTHLSYYKDIDFLLNRSFARMAAEKAAVFWTLDMIGLSVDYAPAWQRVVDARRDGRPLGALLGYFDFGGGRHFKVDGNFPVLTPTSLYEDTTAIIVEKLTKIAGEPIVGTPVIFISASAWSNQAYELGKILAPLREIGINFVLPVDAITCLRNQ